MFVDRALGTWADRQDAKGGKLHKHRFAIAEGQDSTIADISVGPHDVTMRLSNEATFQARHRTQTESGFPVARTLAVSDIGLELRAQMYELFSNYYDHVLRRQFDDDLASKQFIILLEAAGNLVGFTTASAADHSFEGREVRVIFSGDTIVDHKHWGQQALAKAWLTEMGRLSRQAGPRRLFWFLIVKGHRTYRYLPTFALRYVPSSQGDESPDLVRLRDALAMERFGSHYDIAGGVVHFEESRGQLRSRWAVPSERELGLSEVAFFLSANPGFQNGDELACLTEIARENMRPLARRWFDEGFRAQ